MSVDRHAQPAGRAAEPLYDVNIPTPTHAERARTLVARIPTGTLCTLALEPEGYPYGSSYRVEPSTRMVLVMMIQLRPNTTTIGNRFPTLVFQAFADEK